jgi:hypothetical protein
MAPEQAEGKSSAIGPATDIYALGAILYELLTGRPPFAGATLLETLKQVCTEEPERPTRLLPGIPRDLETICLKCLEKAPARRYASAEELADDLHRYLQGELIHARPFTVLDRVSRMLNRSEMVLQVRGLNTLVLPLVAPLPFLTHLAAFLLASSTPHYALTSAIVSIATVVGIVAFFLVTQGTRLLFPVRTNLLQFWSFRVGHLIGMLLLFLVGYLMAEPGTWNVLTLYPQWAVMAGTLFFGLGSFYWGRLYLIGLFYFAAAVAMALRLEWAPVEFGLVLSTTLTAAGLHVQRLKEAGGQAE